MGDIAKEASSYVAMRLARWQNRKNEAATKGELAQLRRGIGKKPGELPELWGLLFEDLPENLMSKTAEASKIEWAVDITLSMYALHQQGSDIGSPNVQNDKTSLGKAIGKLVHNGDDKERVIRRFNIFATAADIQECAHYLRGLVQLLRSEDIPLNYPSLVRDLYAYQFSDGQAKIRLRWGRDFYSVINGKNKEEDKNETK